MALYTNVTTDDGVCYIFNMVLFKIIGLNAMTALWHVNSGNGQTDMVRHGYFRNAEHI